MPDSQQPPSWGPAYHDRDLDALLSGDAGNTPVALRPVASTLAALRAAPAPRELSAEASARAAFRAMAQPPVPWATEAEHGTVTSDTLVLSLPPAAASLPPADHRLPRGERRAAGHLLPAADRRAARHRRHRPPTWTGRRSAFTLTSVAAVAVIAIAVAVTGAIPGSIGQVSGSHPTGAASSAAPTGRTPGSLEGTGGASHPSQRPTVSDAPSVSPSATTGGGTLCRELFAPLGHESQATRMAALKALIRLAGRHVRGYCFRYLSPSSLVPPPPHPNPTSGGYPGGPGDRGQGQGHPGGGNSGGRKSGAANSGAANSGIADSGAGPTPAR